MLAHQSQDQTLLWLPTSTLKIVSRNPRSSLISITQFSLIDFLKNFKWSAMSPQSSLHQPQTQANLTQTKQIKPLRRVSSIFHFHSHPIIAFILLLLLLFILIFFFFSD